jgi:pimeloyl-ACP methyl ester carboxylesterase
MTEQKIEQGRARRLLWRISLTVLLTLVITGATAGALFYFRPTWVLDKYQHLRLAISGVETNEVRIYGHRIHYYVQGPANGQPVVLVHGLGGRGEDWGNLAPYLVKAGYRVYTPDLLGFGQSEEPHNANYSIAEQAKIVVGFFDRVGLQQPDLVGWSMGGWIVQKVAVTHPDRVRRLVLMDSAGLRVAPNWDTRLFTPSTPDELSRLNELLTPNPPSVPGFVAQDILRVSANTSWVIKRALASMFSAKDVTDDDLPALKMPVLILWGDQDRITPLTEGRAIHALIPQSRLEVARGCGHLAPQQCSDRFGPEMAAFLQSPTGLPAGESLLAER